MILRIYFENGIRSVFQRTARSDKVTENFETVNQVIVSFYNSDHVECVIHTSPLEEQGPSYKIKRTFEGRFFTLYASQSGKGWIPRLVYAEWPVIKNFFGVG